MTCTCPRCQIAPAPRSPLASLPGWDIAERIVAEQLNQQAIQRAADQSAWRDTFIDPDAEKLAADVVLEHARAG